MACEEFFSDGILNFAHRGFTEKAPENSMSAFQAALELGVDGIELDVRTCKSGEVVVFHDYHLGRMTDGNGYVKKLTLDQLRSLRLVHQQQITSGRIPTLDEVLELLKNRTLINIELKSNSLPKNNLERQVQDVLRRHDIRSTVLVSSFNPLAVRKIKRIDRQLPAGYLIDKKITIKNSELFLSRFTGSEAIHIHQQLATTRLLQKIRSFGFYSVVWTVNEIEDMKKFIAAKVNAIITDKPDVLKSLLTSFAT